MRVGSIRLIQEWKVIDYILDINARQTVIMVLIFEETDQEGLRVGMSVHLTSSTANLFCVNSDWRGAY